MMNPKDISELVGQMALDFPGTPPGLSFRFASDGPDGATKVIMTSGFKWTGKACHAEAGALEPALTARIETERLDVVWLSRAPVEAGLCHHFPGMLLYERDVATRVEYEDPGHEPLFR